MLLLAQLAQVPYAEVELSWDRLLDGAPQRRAGQLRGALARAFAADDRFHQHGASGKALYRYPRVQYRWGNGRGLVAGWGDAADTLPHLPWLDLALELGGQPLRVTDVRLTTCQGTFGVSRRLERYDLASPVLLFNQQNFPRYNAMPAEHQALERDRLLVAQLLAAMAGLEVRFSGHLYATFTDARLGTCRHKAQKLLGIGGRFVSNAVLPPGFAFGHAVSHGFGVTRGRQASEPDREASVPVR